MGAAGGAVVSRGPEGPRYCPRCGAMWNPMWVECGQCAGRRGGGEVEGGAGVSGARWQSLGSPLALYFSLLGVSALMIVVGMVWRGGAELVLMATGMGTLLVVLWGVFSWDSMAPTLRQGSHFYWYAAAGGLGFATFAVAQITIEILQMLFHVHAGGISGMFLHRGYGWEVIILATCVQPAIIEELAFRGIILGGLRQILSGREAVLVSAAMFMILHLSPLSFPHLLTIGIILGYLRVRTGSIYPGMVLHFVHNSLCLVWEKLA